MDLTYWYGDYIEEDKKQAILQQLKISSENLTPSQQEIFDIYFAELSLKDDLGFETEEYHPLLKHWTKMIPKTRLSSISQYFSDDERVVLDIIIGTENTARFLYSLDKILLYPVKYDYLRSDYKHSLRSPYWNRHLDQASNVFKNFITCYYRKLSPIDILKELEDYWWNRYDSTFEKYIYYNCLYPHILTTAIDFNDTKLIAYIKDILTNNTKRIIFLVVDAIVRSNNTTLHKMLANVLTQPISETVRRTIIENMINGTKEAFITILKVVKDNNLIRYKTAQTALYDWTNYNWTDLEKNYTETISFMYLYLTDSKACKEALNSDNVLEIYLALWSYAFDDTDKAKQLMKKLISQDNYTAHLATARFLYILRKTEILNYYPYERYNQSLRFKLLAKTLIQEPFNYDYNTLKLMAVLTNDCSAYFELDDYNQDILIHCYKRLKDLISYIKGDMIFSSDNAPQNTKILSIECLIYYMAKLLPYLPKEFADDFCDELVKGDKETRDDLISLYSKPTTQKQRNLLIKFLTNRDDNSSTRAFEILQELPLTKTDYNALINLLKSPSEKIYNFVSELLLQQSSKDLFTTITFLLDSKSKNMRLNGLKFLLALNDIKDYQEVFLQGTQYLDTIQHKKFTKDEMELIHRLLKQNSDMDLSSYLNSNDIPVGINIFVKLLAVLGKRKLKRRARFSEHEWTEPERITDCLEISKPSTQDTAQDLATAFEQANISTQRRVDIALFAPQWLPLISEVLNWQGFIDTYYFFKAHTLFYPSEEGKDLMHKLSNYSSLSLRSICNGAFDTNWFWKCYTKLGEQRFNVLYNAVKYISTNNRHARVQKYIDAVLGKLNPTELELKITKTRNKDLLMAYGLIPLSTPDETLRRYKFIQEFLKQSKPFGAQRRNSEKLVSEIAVDNLSRSAKFADSFIFKLHMESQLFDYSIFKPHKININGDSITLTLNINEQGKASLTCQKNDTLLKSLPAYVKKTDIYLSLKATQKEITDQYKQVRTIFEHGMISAKTFIFKEIATLENNPLIAKMLTNLVFITQTDTGYLRNNTLVDPLNKTTLLKPDTTLTIAHPLTLAKLNILSTYQKDIADRKQTQSIEQLSRKIYLKNAEELSQKKITRYKGVEIQPYKSYAILKQNGWKYSYEDGICKTYHQYNITIIIDCEAVFFDILDSEPIQLDTIDFYKTSTFAKLPIKEVPDIIFSEVIRDIELIVNISSSTNKKSK